MGTALGPSALAYRSMLTCPYLCKFYCHSLLASAWASAMPYLVRCPTARTPFLPHLTRLCCPTRSELLSEDEEPLLLLPPAHVSTALWVALRVLAAGDKQLAAWGGIEVG